MGVLQVPDPGRQGGGCRHVAAGPGERRLAARQQPAARQQSEAAHGMRAEDDAFKLRANALHGNVRQLVTLAQETPPSILGDPEIKH
nr:hypothetical protein [Paenibacillus sp. P46E]